MSWYKNIIKFSSWNLKFPENIYPQIDETVNLFFNTLNNLTELPSSPVIMKRIQFNNSYQENSVLSYSNIYLNNNFVEDTNTLAMRDRITGDIFINVYKVFFMPQKVNVDINYFKEELRNHLIHELSHAVDPKIVNLNKVYNYPEYLRPTEFDAYSKEITSYIYQAYQNDNNKEILKNWIIGVNFGRDEENKEIKEIKEIEKIRKILFMPERNYQLIKKWRDENPEFYRKLRQRLYNEVLNESSS